MAPMFMENPSEASSNTVIVAVEQARDALLAALGGVSFGSLGDEESLSMLLALESVGRVVDGARVLSTTDVLRRSEYLDASVAATAAEVTADQTELAAAGAVSLARRLGCRSGLVLVSTLARLSRGEVRQRASLGKNAGERMLLGRPLAPTYPVVGEALQGGKLGVEQARVIVKVLDELRPSVLVDDRDRVERSLVASGSGAITPETEGLPGAGIAFAPESLRLQGIAWQARLAPDGSAPGEAATERRSWLAFGGLANGGYSLSGWLTTLDRAIISTVFDAYLSSAAANPVPGAAPRAKVAFRETDPCADDTASDVATSGSASSDSDTNDSNTIRLDSDAGLTESGAFAEQGEQGEQAEQGSATVQNGRNDDYDESARGENGDLHGSDRPATLSPCPQEPADARSISEKQAGILRAVFEAAARQPSTPTMGGAAPTVLVHININDLLAGRGAGWIDGIDGPLTVKLVDELICAGGYQPVLFGHKGQVLHLGNSNRFFTAQQRRALAARDGGCVIPGCTVPPHLAQVHHVVPWRAGGLTDIDNAVLLCDPAHASIETSGWDIDMRDGRPWLRGPLLFDATQTWRPGGQNRAASPAEKPNWEK
ncbi:HNH endonuclease [Cryobacterium sp. TMT1-2-2]|uniref:HNH endonuclease signature motif containing protein n=1 Tax=Cryobacterium sp. TMT1-2-2 TaxID=1259233 RepID=UPI001069BB73|nr:HNH endonuclease signature motif containing protein [Cryobacterium sp. TMT1-2-2]TFD14871.1 HNH endonuclease [Cryobacterium sp. TMT1-2-2]